MEVHGLEVPTTPSPPPERAGLAGWDLLRLVTSPPDDLSSLRGFMSSAWALSPCSSPP